MSAARLQWPPDLFDGLLGRLRCVAAKHKCLRMIFSSAYSNVKIKAKSMENQLSILFQGALVRFS